MLEDPLGKDFDIGICDLRLCISEHEQTKVEELVRKLGRPEYEQWFRRGGEVCLPHARRVLDRAPKEVRAGIAFAVQRHTAELRSQLIALSHSAQAGMAVHPGLLGRVAEYLAAKRSLTIEA